VKDWRSIVDDWPVADPMITLERLQSAHTFLRRRIGLDVPRDEMQALMDAQALLLKVRFAVLNEAERVWRALDPEVRA
jgi:hypothetical protein